jgi:F-type H+-transporting ATPase subunit epsilon
MAQDFSFELVSPEGVAFSAEVESLVLPGASGSLGVLRSHEPWVVLLKEGMIEYRNTGGDWQRVRIGGGVASIEGERTLVLADSIGN